MTTVRRALVVALLQVAVVASGAGSGADMNGDGKVDLGDPLRLLAFLFAEGRAPEPCAVCWYGSVPRGDINLDGKCNIGDAIATLMYLFAGGREPPECPECYPCTPARLPATGATKCYDADTRTEIPCESAEWPGQDGYYRTGCPLAGRFVDNGDGTVSDTCTGLMWQKDAPMLFEAPEQDPDGRVLWQTALRYCERLAHAGYDDWRLPNAIELMTLIHDWTRVPIDVFLDPLFVEGSPLEEWKFWGSSFYPCRGDEVVCVQFRGGGTGADSRPLVDVHHVRAVRAGLETPCASGLPATGISTCHEPPSMTEIPCDSVEWPGQDGYYRAGRPVEGRFLDHGDGTVTDLATGLMWVRATPAPGVEYDPDGDGKVLWQEALLFCHGLEFAGHDDWRLPNVVELLSIMSLPYMPGNPDHPPLDLEIGGYWTSTASAVRDGWGAFWLVSRCFGATTSGPNMPYRVHPVRGGL